MPESFDNLHQPEYKKQYISRFKRGEYSSSEVRMFMRTAMAHRDARIVDMLLKHGVKPTFTKFAIVAPHLDPKRKREVQKLADVLKKHGVSAPKLSSTKLKKSLMWARSKQSTRKRSVKQRSTAIKRNTRKQSVKRRSTAIKRKTRKQSVKRRSSTRRPSTQKDCKRKKISRTMGEFKRKSLKLRNGKPVTNRRQAIAIALSQADRYC